MPAPSEGKDKKNDSKRLLMLYGSLASEMVIMIAIGVYIGLWLDKKFPVSIPLFVWVLPLLIIFLFMYKVIKDTSNRRKK